MKEDRPAMDRTQEEWSSRVENLALRLDRLFGGEEYRKTATGTQLRVGTEVLLGENEVEFDEIVRLNLELPVTEERLDLVFENDREDEFDRERDRTPQGLLSDRGEDYRAGFRYLKAFADRWNFDADLGLRWGSPVEPFTRLRVRRDWLAAGWYTELAQSVYWYREDGLGETTQLLLQRPVGAKHLFRSDSEVSWLRDEDKFYYGQDLLLSRQFNQFHALIYQVGVRGESQPNDRVTAYFANVRWRRNVYKDWLFVELKPELLFTREEDFEPEPRLLFTVEAWFGEPKYEDETIEEIPAAVGYLGPVIN